MTDLNDRLAALAGADHRPADELTVAADLRRCHAAAYARSRRRRYTTGVAGVATLGLVAAGTLSFAGTDDAPSGPASRAAAPPSVTSGTATAAAPKAPALQLVAYTGRQLPGYTVARVPQGYVLQGISASVLVIAERGNRTSLDVFENKLVVMLNDVAAPKQGQPVTVKGAPGYVRTEDGIRTLAYADGKYNVSVQAWSNINITTAQLVHFAEGVTILPNVQVGHG